MQGKKEDSLIYQTQLLPILAFSTTQKNFKSARSLSMHFLKINVLCYCTPFILHFQFHVISNIFNTTNNDKVFSLIHDSHSLILVKFQISQYDLVTAKTLHNDIWKTEATFQQQYHPFLSTKELKQ